MRIFREAGMSNAVRGETHVWTIETDSQAEAENVWEWVRLSTCSNLLHWNDGAERSGVCFEIDIADVAEMKRVAKLAKSEFKKDVGAR